jgi:exonuclease III
MSVLVQANDDIEPWCFTGVYGPQTNANKVEWLDELRAIQTSITCPWLIAGDFNIILDATDKTNMNLNQQNMGRFRRFVDELELKGVPLHVRLYTWSSGRERPKLEK